MTRIASPAQFRQGYPASRRTDHRAKPTTLSWGHVSPEVIALMLWAFHSQRGVQSTSSVSLRTNQSLSSANLLSMRRRVSATCRRCAPVRQRTLRVVLGDPQPALTLTDPAPLFLGIRGHLYQDVELSIARSSVGGHFPKEPGDNLRGR